MKIAESFTVVQVLNMRSFFLVFEKASIGKEEIGWEIQLSVSSWNKLLDLIKYWEDQDKYRQSGKTVWYGCILTLQNHLKIINAIADVRR